MFLRCVFSGDVTLTGEWRKAKVRVRGQALLSSLSSLSSRSILQGVDWNGTARLKREE